MLRDETLCEEEYNAYIVKLGDFDINMLNWQKKNPKR
jgi:hypothetical protein